MLECLQDLDTSLLQWQHPNTLLVICKLQNCPGCLQVRFRVTRSQQGSKQGRPACCQHGIHLLLRFVQKCCQLCDCMLQPVLCCLELAIGVSSAACMLPQR